MIRDASSFSCCCVSQNRDKRSGERPGDLQSHSCSNMLQCNKKRQAGRLAEAQVASELQVAAVVRRARKRSAAEAAHILEG